MCDVLYCAAKLQKTLGTWRGSSPGGLFSISNSTSDDQPPYLALSLTITLCYKRRGFYGTLLLSIGEVWPGILNLVIYYDF